MVLSSPGEPLAITDFRMSHGAGPSLWCEAMVTNLLHDDDVAAIVFNAHDVTDRRIAEQRRFSQQEPAKRRHKAHQQLGDASDELAEETEMQAAVGNDAQRRRRFPRELLRRRCALHETASTAVAHYGGRKGGRSAAKRDDRHRAGRGAACYAGGRSQ